ncbi:MAG: Holo-(acyl-carrier-protein) synthase [Firmicutes bacterium ADurb.Bin193]|nr:MAG: Holo-(acyl-carrier-protein) synthase [Firmicutes bacterium ADurb.Bin193]
MITGNGIDIVEIERIRAALIRRPQLLFRIFTENERRYFKERANNIATIAGCFAAKEATVKAAGGGYVRNVELRWDESGRPSAKMAGFEDIKFFVSITHTKEYAAASVVAVSGVF